jgi:hypothetical protein
MTRDCSTLPVLTPLWEIQANYANTIGAVGAALRHQMSVIPEFPWVTSKRAGTEHSVTSTVTEGRNVRGASIVPVFETLSHIIRAVCGIHAFLLNILCLCVCIVRQGDTSVDRHKCTVSYWLFVVMKLLTASVTVARIAVWQISSVTQEPSSTVLPVQSIRHIERYFSVSSCISIHYV